MRLFQYYTSVGQTTSDSPRAADDLVSNTREMDKIGDRHMQQLVGGGGYVA